MDGVWGVAHRHRIFLICAALAIGLLAAVFGVALAAPSAVPSAQPPTPTPPSGGGGGGGGGGFVTPTVAPPPWRLVPTPNPASVVCPPEPPSWWGQVTPSAYWWFLCSECVQRWGAAAWPRFPTPTPQYVFPTFVFSVPTPWITGTPTLTVTPVPTFTPTPSATPTPGPLPTPTPSPSYTGPVTGLRRFEPGRPTFCGHSWWIEPHPEYDEMVFGVYHPCGEYRMLLIYAAGQEDSKFEAVVVSHLMLEFERDPPPWPDGRVPPGVVYYPPISVSLLITYLIPFESTNLVRLSTSGSYHMLTGYVSIPSVSAMSFTTREMTLRMDGQRRVVHLYMTLEAYFPRLDSPVSSRGGQFEVRVDVDTCPCGCSSPTPTPTPTPVFTVTPTPTATPVYTGSPCDDPFIEGTPYRIIGPPILGDAHCLEFGPYDWESLGVSIPRVVFCFQEIYFGSVEFLGVSVNLDLLVALFVSVALIRWIANVS